MPVATNANADDYANARLNIFFSGVTPDLDGQCVSLVKGFLQDMTSVPNPQAARGDARYMGHTLVSQGHAIEVPYSERRRGDVICYEYGTYGHIGVVLSGDRTFEENVNWPGVASKIIDGARVYASRIGALSEGWRHDQHIYRIKSYNEGGGNMPTLVDDGNIDLLYLGTLHRKPGQADKDARRGQDYLKAMQELFESKEWSLQDTAIKTPQTGNAPTGTYLKVDPANVINVK